MPAVTISADGTSVTEGGDATFTVSANPAPAFDLVVHVSAEEEMGAGDDRVAVGHLGTVTIRAGTASATWTVTTTGDEVARADGTVAARIQSGYDYTVGNPSSVTVTLLDDDGVTTQSVPDSVVGVDPALVALVRGYAAETWKHPDHVKRWMRVLAAFGDDNGYTPMTAAEAQTHADKGWQRWVPVAAALAALEAAQQPLTLPAVSVSAGADVTEGGDAVFTVTANPAPAAALSVTVTVATVGEFGVTAGTQTVPIPTTGSATLTLATSDDEADEADGSVSGDGSGRQRLHGGFPRVGDRGHCRRRPGAGNGCDRGPRAGGAGSGLCGGDASGPGARGPLEAGSGRVRRRQRLHADDGGGGADPCRQGLATVGSCGRRPGGAGGGARDPAGGDGLGGCGRHGRRGCGVHGDGEPGARGGAVGDGDRGGFRRVRRDRGHADRPHPDDGQRHADAGDGQ